MVVHQYLGGGSHLQPLLGWCLILLPPRHPCVMEVEQVLGFSGGVCFPLVCTPLHLASACVWIVFDLDTPISLLLVICLPCP